MDRANRVMKGRLAREQEQSARVAASEIFATSFGGLLLLYYS